eukprot:365922-Chlamydomonas_euryale.AAC.5
MAVKKNTAWHDTVWQSKAWQATWFCPLNSNLICPTPAAPSEPATGSRGARCGLIRPGPSATMRGAIGRSWRRAVTLASPSPSPSLPPRAAPPPLPTAACPRSVLRRCMGRAACCDAPHRAHFLQPLKQRRERLFRGT